jgi:hypothetical protein
MTITKRALKIPVSEESFGEFCRQMKTGEKLLKNGNMYHDYYNHLIQHYQNRRQAPNLPVRNYLQNT